MSLFHLPDPDANREPPAGPPPTWRAAPVKLVTEPSSRKPEPPACGLAEPDAYPQWLLDAYENWQPKPPSKRIELHLMDFAVLWYKGWPSKALIGPEPAGEGECAEVRAAELADAQDQAKEAKRRQFQMAEIEFGIARRAAMQQRVARYSRGATQADVRRAIRSHIDATGAMIATLVERITRIERHGPQRAAA